MKRKQIKRRPFAQMCFPPLRSQRLKCLIWTIWLMKNVFRQELSHFFTEGDALKCETEALTGKAQLDESQMGKPTLSNVQTSLLLMSQFNASFVSCHSPSQCALFLRAKCSTNGNGGRGIGPVLCRCKISQ